MIKRLSIASLLGLALAACGGGGGGSLSAGEAWTENLEEVCTKAHECRDSFPSGQGVTFEQLYGNDVAGCVDSFEMFLGTAAQVDASAEAGRIDYDEADAQACLDATDFGSLTCDQFWAGEDQDIPECETALVGAVANGGSCTISLDCMDFDALCEGGVCTVQ